MIKEFTFKSRESYYKAILKVVNCFIGLTEYELSIIAYMLVYDIKILNAKSRSFIRSKTGNNIASLNNYIKRLKDKKALVITNGGLKISDNIINSISDGQVSIKFNIEEYVNEDSGSSGLPKE